MENFDIQQFFQQFDTQESYFFLAMAVLWFLLGILLGIVLRARRVRSLRKALAEKEKELDESQKQLAAKNEELSLKEADLKKIKFERDEADSKAERLETEKRRLEEQAQRLNSDLKQEKATSQSYVDTIEDLNNQILGLKARNEKLATDAGGASPTGADAPAEGEDRFKLFENKLNRLERENQSLKIELNAIKSQAGGVGDLKGAQPGAPSPGENTLESSPEEKPPRLDDQQPQHVMGKRLSSAEPHEKDDLTRIEGIGPFIEKKLNGIGIYTYQQIARFDQAKIEQVTRDIQFFEGRIERDNWVGQAQRLLENKEQQPVSAPAETTDSPDTEDLKVIEGVGAQEEQLLKYAGINNWEELAKADINFLRTVLEGAGQSYADIDPHTWPTQARMALDRNWDLLRDYQAQLKEGS